MIVDKNIKPVEPEETPLIPEPDPDPMEEVIETNEMVEAYKAVRKIL